MGDNYNRFSAADACERGDGATDFQFLPLRAEDERAIEELGITVADFLFFRLKFVGSPWGYATKRVSDVAWSLRRRPPLSTPLLLEHLRAERWIACGARWNSLTKRFVANWFALDLDLKDDVGDLHRRYDGVQRAFGRPSLVFRSSNSGGLHLYYFLDELLNLHQLRQPDGKGALARLLRSAGIIEANGLVEIYPRGQYRVRGVGNRLRLPFGAGSILLDHESLLPLASPYRGPLGDLQLVRRLFSEGKVEPLASKDLLQRSYAIESPAESGRSRRVVRANDDDIARRDGYVAQLKSVGLTEKDEFNKAVSALAFDGLWSGVEADDTTNWIVEWLDSGFHSGYSGTFTADPRSAAREVHDTVRRIFARHRPSMWSAVPALTETDARRLLEATSGDVVSDPTTGEVLNRFKVQRFAFELHRRAKQYVLTIGGRAWSRAQTGDAQLAAVSDVWPDPSTDEFIVACPYALRVSLPLITERTVGPSWNALKETGLFRLHQSSAWPRPMCERYRVRLNFDQGERRFETMEAAALAMIGAGDIRRFYSRSHARRILAARPPDIQPAPEISDFERFIERKLAASRAERAA